VQLMEYCKIYVILLHFTMLDGNKNINGLPQPSANYDRIINSSLVSLAIDMSD